MSYKNILDRRNYHRIYMKERRDMFKKLHLCSECGNEDVSTMIGYKQCIKCRELRSGHKIDYDKFMLSDEELKCQEPKIKRNERFLYGLCYICGENIEYKESKWGGEIIKLCKQCYQRNCQIAEKRIKKILAPSCNTKNAWDNYRKLKAKSE